MASTSATWHVRSEDGVGEGYPVDFATLSQGVTDGVWSETAQVSEPGGAGWMLVGNHPSLEALLPPKPLFCGAAPEEAEMDMTPMIDVTFQLIIFFMITATFVVQKTLDMPQPTADPTEPARLPTLSELQAENVVVTIRGDGGVLVDDAPIEMGGLAAALGEAAKKNPGNVEMILDVDDQASYDVVVKVIDSAAGAEIEKVHFLRRAGKEPPPGPG